MKKNNKMYLGIILILISAFLTSFGQLLWKIGCSGNLIVIFSGFILYGIGAILMIAAMKFGKLSIIHPMMCVGYIFGLINGRVFLNEHVSIVQVMGITVIILGVIFIAKGGDSNE